MFNKLIVSANYKGKEKNLLVFVVTVVFHASVIGVLLLTPLIFPAIRTQGISGRVVAVFASPPKVYKCTHKTSSPGSGHLVVHKKRRTHKRVNIDLTKICAPKEIADEIPPPY